ncbi:MAG: class I SAM-dependent methyltransferase [Phycisphaerae bacterium]|nr:class I SAM-dependent methyltransferase [Phycisphaerae bacterium]
MSTRTIQVTDEIQQYLVEATLREPELWRRLREETFATTESPEMQISPEQGQFMKLLVESIGAKRTIEIGTFTGYSALCVASALPADGKLIACDVSEEWTSVARRYWAEAGLANKIELRLGPAIDTLDHLLNEEGQTGTFDFAFIDADKTEYDAYYERVLRLLRPGGLLAIDNALGGGFVVTPEVRPSAAAIDALNRKIRDDKRVTCSLVPIGDGLMLARKR